MGVFATFKGDLAGAVTAATLTIPPCIGYGIIVFAPLGVNFAPHGALLGLYTAVFAGFLASWLGGNPVQISGPKAPSTLVLAAVVAFLVVNPHIPLPQAMAPRVAVAIGLVSVTIVVGGIFQAALGSLGCGNLIKYVPYPVVAGFTNGIALVLVLKQLAPLLGLSGKMGMMAILHHLANIEPLTIVVGLSTLVAIFLAPRWVKAVPASVTGLIVGTVMYYGIGALGGFSGLGPLIGKISTEWPEPKVFLDLLQTWNGKQVWAILPYLLIPGVMLGLLGSLESLLTCVASDHLTGNRHNSNRELIAQGIGNIVAAFFGSIFAAGSVPRTLANYRAGGRTSLSGMMASVIVLLVIVGLGSLVGKIPLAVIAGIIISVAIKMVDKETINILTKLVAAVRQERQIPLRQESDILFDLLISMTVAVITISVNLIIAVGIGIVIASLLFISKMGKSIIRREYSGHQVHSKKARPRTHSTVLEREGWKMVVFELQGPLFFGSAEILAKEVEQAWEKAAYCILDMKRVNDIDSTGAGIILHLISSGAKSQKHCLISYMKGNPALWKFMEIMDRNKTLQTAQFFPDTDLALEWAEEHLLAQFYPSSEISGKIPLNQMDITQGFNDEELAILQRRLIFQTYAKDELIIRQGDTSRDLFLLTKGAVTVKVRLPHRQRLKRVFTFGPGVIFGEMALLDAKPRSADVWAQEDSEVLMLSYDQFVALSQEEPKLAVKLIVNIAQVLSRNLRRSARELQALEDS
jgi:SulP family sulfate permease